jgi:hypothetical protein
MSILSNNTRNLSNLVRFTDSGFSVASFVDIQKALVTRWKTIYGTDIDLSNGSADGQFVYEIALMINNMCQSLLDFQSRFSIETATGADLDTLASFANITRKAATASICTVTVSTSVDGTFTIPVDTTFLDINGNTWHIDTSRLTYWTESNTITTTTPLVIPLECDDIGKINCEAGTVTDFAELKDEWSVLVVTQTDDGSIGADAETDAALRARRSNGTTSQAVTVLDSMLNELLSIPAVTDCYIKNDTAHHIIEVYIKQKYSSDNVRSLIANAIYRKLTPGIATCWYGANVNDSTAISSFYTAEYTYLVDKVMQTRQIVRWNACKDYDDVTFAITISKKNYFNSTTDVSKIMKNVADYINNLLIGEVISPKKISNVIDSADSKYFGERTFSFNYVTQLVMTCDFEVSAGATQSNGQYIVYNSTTNHLDDFASKYITIKLDNEINTDTSSSNTYYNHGKTISITLE